MCVRVRVLVCICALGTTHRHAREFSKVSCIINIYSKSCNELIFENFKSYQCNSPTQTASSCCLAVRCSALQCVAVRCSALQCVAVRCSALRCVAVRCSVTWQLAQPANTHRIFVLQGYMTQMQMQLHSHGASSKDTYYIYTYVCVTHK